GGGRRRGGGPGGRLSGTVRRRGVSDRPIPDQARGRARGGRTHPACGGTAAVRVVAGREASDGLDGNGRAPSPRSDRPHAVPGGRGALRGEASRAELRGVGRY